jgi:RNA polymerase sigma-70 factor (ECF subfamily)
LLRLLPPLLLEILWRVGQWGHFLFSKETEESSEGFRIPKQERLLVEAIQRDKNHFESLYNAFFEKIFRFAFHRVSDEYIAEEVTSSVFIKAYKSIDQFQYREYSISSWLFKITINEINLYFRKHKHQIRNVSLKSENSEHLFDEMALEDHSQIELTRLAKVLEELEEDEVEFIELRFFENYSFKEIGYFLNITPDNAKTKTYRILEKMKKLLLKFGHGKD